MTPAPIAAPRTARPLASARSRPLLSACLIVKNEERVLGRCLRSVKPLVDEIVVVDTGSTDRTPEIAREAGARVHRFRWREDFSAARNHALGLARGEWILHIDADETVRPCRPSRLGALLAMPSYVAYHVRFHPRPGFTPYWEVRLFRNDPHIRFRGIIHETIWPDVEAYQSAHNARIGRSDLVFEHEGYEGDQRAKHRRNLPLLRRALRRDPTRVFSWCHLASVYLGLGKPRLAEKAWTAGLRVVREKRRVLAEDSLPYIGLIEWAAGRGRDVEPLLEESLRKFPRNAHLRWLQGRALARTGRFAEAIPVFERLLAAGERGNWDHAMAYDCRLFDLFSYVPLATCHFKLGRYAEARRYFAFAAQRDAENIEYRAKSALCARLGDEAGHS